MTFRLVDAGWGRELADALHADHASLRIVCPFIKRNALERLLQIAQPGGIQVITRFNLKDFAEGVSDIPAVRLLMERGAQVRGVRKLHAKLYLFGKSRAVVTSANLTGAALSRNHELGCVATDTSIVERCHDYFDDLWSRAGKDLTSNRVAGWEAKVARYLAAGARPDRRSERGDEGVDAGFEADDRVPVEWMADVRHAFVKFLGEGDNRAPLSLLTLEELNSAGCHWAVAYPATKRPIGVKDGALMFIGRLTKDPNDIRVFGRAIGMRYVRERDDATDGDKALRPWKEKWPRYIRVHHAEFVAGSMANGVSLNELMNSLKADAFMSTQRNAAKGQGNTDPRNAYRQHAAVELSPEGLAWLNSQLEHALTSYGKLAPAEMARLDWPSVPRPTGTRLDR